MVKIKDSTNNLISLDDLIASKEIAGRTIDVQDVDKLKKMKQLMNDKNQI